MPAIRIENKLFMFIAYSTFSQISDFYAYWMTSFQIYSQVEHVKKMRDDEYVAAISMGSGIEWLRHWYFPCRTWSFLKSSARGRPTNILEIYLKRDRPTAKFWRMLPVIRDPKIPNRQTFIQSGQTAFIENKPFIFRPAKIWIDNGSPLSSNSFHYFHACRCLASPIFASVRTRYFLNISNFRSAKEEYLRMPLDIKRPWLLEIRALPGIIWITQLVGRIQRPLLGGRKIGIFLISPGV